MFSQFSHFFIKNSKLTFVFVLIILLSGVGSYIFLPKQYNPSITLPAFQIQIPIHEMDSLQAYNIIGSAFENSINEIS
jgi:multidrug efflux pump subunit AcrB